MYFLHWVWTEATISDTLHELQAVGCRPSVTTGTKFQSLAILKEKLHQKRDWVDLPWLSWSTSVNFFSNAFTFSFSFRLIIFSNFSIVLALAVTNCEADVNSDLASKSDLLSKRPASKLARKSGYFTAQGFEHWWTVVKISFDPKVTFFTTK